MQKVQLYARDLVESQVSLSANTTVRQALDWFREEGRPDFVAVATRESIVGILGRDQLNSRLAGQYGFSVLADKPISKVMSPASAFMEGGKDLIQVATELLDSGRAGADFYQDLIVHEGGQFLGLVSVKRLMMVLTNQLVRQMHDLQRQSELLALKDRELLEAGVRGRGGVADFVAFFEQCSIPLALFTVSGKFLRANAAFLRLTGHTAESLEGSSLASDIFGPAIDGHLREFGNKAMSGRRRAMSNPRVELRHREGSSLHVEISIDVPGEADEVVVSVLRVVSAGEQDLQRVLEERFANRSGLAKQVVNQLIDKEQDTASLVSKIDALLDYAEMLQSRAGGASAVPEEEQSLRGDLSRFSLLDLCQLLIGGGKTGELEIVAGDGPSGRIYFAEGQIVHATLGDRVGVPALESMVRQESGTFVFNYKVRPQKVTISGDSTYILLSACTTSDESQMAIQRA